LKEVVKLALYSKCIFDPVETSDGLRISVMSRHTHNDGKTIDERIIPGVTYVQWRRELAPSDLLVGSHYRNRISWEAFADRYLLDLKDPVRKSAVELLAEQAMLEDITILCVEHNSEHCHRRLLAAACKEYLPELIVKHR
jgi:uncharacterized protein YeaO (DUF488 family)